MKKTLAIGLGVLMVAGSGSPAIAASQIDFSGYYRIMYMSETNNNHGRDFQSFTDSYFQDRLNLELSFKPTDEIAVYWRLRSAGSYQRWGSHNKDMGTQYINSNMETHYIYGEINQSWGDILIGAISDDLDVYGLASLGYQPENTPVYTNVGPFDRADVLDGLRYSHRWDNGFSFMAQYGKLDNNDQSSGNINNLRLNRASDQDYDRYQIEGTYVWDGGGAGLGFFYDRNATERDRSDWVGWKKSEGSYRADFELPTLDKVERWGLNPAFMHSWGAFSLHFEGMAQWGRLHYLYDQDPRFYDPNLINAPSAPHKGEISRAASGYGAYLDVDYNYGPGNVTLAAWWIDGSALDDGKNKSLADLVGGNFYPLLVAYNGENLNPGGSRYYDRISKNNLSAIGRANNAYHNYVFEGYHGGWAVNGPQYRALGGQRLDLDNFSGGPSYFLSQVITADGARRASFNNNTDANHWAVALTGNHAFTDDISMHYGLAYLALNKPNYRITTSATYSSGLLDPTKNQWTATGYTTQSKDLGYEIDLGFSFQLLDNLAFTSAFGYMFNGDAYREFKGFNLLNNGNAPMVQDGASIQGVWRNPDNSYVWFNSLTFSF